MKKAVVAAIFAFAGQLGLTYLALNQMGSSPSFKAILLIWSLLAGTGGCIWLGIYLGETRHASKDPAWSRWLEEQREPRNF